MEPWNPPPKPGQYAEQSLITAILEGFYLPGASLPAERELATQLGVTRPTLREALRRMECDGWLTVQQGKATRVNDYWREGGLNVLSAMVRYSRELPGSFIPNLLEVRLAMAPAYTAAAVGRRPEEVADSLGEAEGLEDSAQAFAAFDWKLHVQLTHLSGNPIFTLILNGFAGFYEQMARLYFRGPAARQASRRFYAELSAAARMRDIARSEAITRRVMQESIFLWAAQVREQP